MRITRRPWVFSPEMESLMQLLSPKSSEGLICGSRYTSKSSNPTTVCINSRVGLRRVSLISKPVVGFALQAQRWIHSEYSAAALAAALVSSPSAVRLSGLRGLLRRSGATGNGQVVVPGALPKSFFRRNLSSLWSGVELTSENPNGCKSALSKDPPRVPGLLFVRSTNETICGDSDEYALG